MLLLQLDPFPKAKRLTVHGSFCRGSQQRITLMDWYVCKCQIEPPDEMLIHGKFRLYSNSRQVRAYCNDREIAIVAI